MKNSRLYYTLPTIRKKRRVIRRLSKKANKEFKDCGVKATIKYHDQNGANILKSRRWRNRIRAEFNDSLNCRLYYGE